MPNPLERNHLWRFVSATGLILLCVFAIRAERLPVRQYTVADGLAQGTVWAMHQDARGFLWLATSDGLSRFDGYRFTNYGVKDGLGDAILRDVVSDQHGRLWLATAEGVSLLLNETDAAQHGKKFQNFLLATGEGASRNNEVHQLLFDAENRLWCVVNGAVYRAKSTEVVAEQFERIAEFDVATTPPQMILERRGRVWVSVNEKLLRIEGRNVTTYQPGQEAGTTKGDPNLRWIKGLSELADGRIVLATQKHLYEYSEPTAANQPGGWRKLPFALPAPNVIGTIHPANDGGLWIGSDAGLTRYRDAQQATYRIGNDPNPFTILSFLSDRDGNLWIGTRQRGLLKLKGETVTVYDSGDGLVAVTEVYYLRSTHDGRMSLRGRPASLACQEFLLTTKSGADQNAILRLQTPPALCLHELLQDKRKNWWALRWIAERKIYKLIFIPGPNPNFSAGYELTAADGWVDGLYTALYEDHEGYLWLRTGTQIFRVEYTNSGRPRVVEIVKEGSSGHAFRFFRDPSGAIWWTNGATVWRQQHGKKETIPLSLNGVRPRSFFADRKGRLWISTVDAGVFMTETPADAQPQFIQYTTANGLLNDYVDAICEDDAERMWFATVRGLCWLDVATGRFSPFAVDDNTLGAAVRDLRKDARGHLWASLMGAVVRINPSALPPPSSQTPVYFNRITVAGEPLAFGEIGATSLAPLELAAASNNLDIEFLSPNFRGDNAVYYQYKLDSVDADWSVPSNVREVNYARLAPGQYTFLARAVNEAGLVSREPASLRFTILRPVWQRWWFLATLAIGLGALIYGGYRYRLGQAVKVERVRTRIAHDLHDDIGANLTRISILSEVAKRQQYNSAPPPGELPSGLLDSIADISRESVAAMNDIVWAINPEHDSLIDLTSRMRRHAEEVFLTRDIRLDFEAPGDAEQLKLDIETRRDLYLVFKEAVNNAARHADCSVVSISVQASATHIQLNIRDNGKGFDQSALTEGNGLLSMRNRAQEMKGKLKIESSPGKGSELSLIVPVLPA